MNDSPLTVSEIKAGWIRHDGSVERPVHDSQWLQFRAITGLTSFPTPAIGWDWRTITAYRPLKHGDTTWPTASTPSYIFREPQHGFKDHKPKYVRRRKRV